MSHVLPFTVGLCASAQDRADALAVRRNVFVREQQVPVELEIDDHDDPYDHDSFHLIARWNDGTPVGTLRVVRWHDNAAKIQRVATLAAFRGQGIGDALMRCALGLIAGYGHPTVILDAQLPVIGFYERLGFVAEGPTFEDAGILHRRMRLAVAAAKPR